MSAPCKAGGAPEEQNDAPERLGSLGGDCAPGWSTRSCPFSTTAQRGAQGPLQGAPARFPPPLRGRLRRGLLSLVVGEGRADRKGGLHERWSHAATCEPLADAGGGVWGRRPKEAHGGPRLPGGGAHIQAHTSTSSHPRALAQPASGGHRGDARQQVWEVSRRPRPRAPVHPGKRFQNAQGDLREGAAHAAREHRARRARGLGEEGGWEKGSVLEGWRSGALS